MLNRVKSLVLATTIAVGAMGAAQAALLDLTGVGGTWSGVQPNGSQTAISGLGTSTLRWGTPFAGPGGSGEQSGYSFTGAASGRFETGVEFDLGTFTHFNKTITRGTSITQARLGVAVGIAIGGVSRVITAAFNFDHLETLNEGRRGRCDNGGRNGAGANVNGCADRVRVLNNAGSTNQFVVDGIAYILEVTGFVVAGRPFSEFWTTERADNSAVLRARFTAVGGTTSGGGEPTPSPIPLPGAAWLILAALGAMAVVGRKRRPA